MSSGVNTREGCRRIVRFAFEHAVKLGRKKVTLVHKANVLKALTGVFLETGQQIAAGLGHGAAWRNRVPPGRDAMRCCAVANGA